MTFIIPHISQSSAYHQHLYKHNYFLPSLELWRRTAEETSISKPQRTLWHHRNHLGLQLSPSSAPQETTLRSPALCLFKKQDTTQRAKLIPRVLKPTAELLQKWEIQQSHLKTNPRVCFEIRLLYWWPTFLTNNRLKKNNTVWLSKLAKSVFHELDGVSLGIKF